MKKPNKFLYGYKIYVCYDNGWEYECFEESYKLMRENVKAYQENCIYPIKVTKGRELNPSYK